MNLVDKMSEVFLGIIPKEIRGIMNLNDPIHYEIRYKLESETEKEKPQEEYK